MIDIKRLSTSLTKHGAHKIAYLLERYGKDGVLRRLAGVEPGINIEEVQAKKNLSAKGGVVPKVWDKARVAGSESVQALVLIGIIFSHHELIEAMREGRRSPFRGELEKAHVLDGKSFTNTAHIIEELGYSVSHTPHRVTYNLSRLFEIPGLHVLVLELLALKFKTAGWNGVGSLVDVLVDGKFNEVFSVSQEQLRNWLMSGDVDAIGDTLGDEKFFLDTDNIGAQPPFVFVPGHTPKKTGAIAVAVPKSSGRAELLHNELQTALDKALVKKYGRAAVGTEQNAGGGTSIDVVVRTATGFWFYEIKVAKTVKACIRQAIPQLLEYAYWRKDNTVAERLIIASKFKLTKDAEEYLGLLRERFSLPLYYERIML